MELLEDRERNDRSAILEDKKNRLTMGADEAQGLSFGVISK